MPLFRSKALKKVEELGYEAERLPPGQYLTEKWPVLHARDVPRIEIASYDFRVYGEVGNPITLRLDELKQLPPTEITVDIHFVMSWSRFATSFKCVHLPVLV